MTRWLEATERAAQSVIDSHDIKQFPGETAIQALAWELGEGALSYENGLTALVESAIKADRTQRAEIHPDWADDREDIRDAHRVDVSWTAYDKDGNILYDSDMELTGAEAAGMFQGIGEASATE